MTPVEHDLRPVRATPARGNERTPEPETRAKFEDALDRREKGAKAKSDTSERASEGLAQPHPHAAMPQGKGLDFMQDERRGGHGRADAIDLSASVPDSGAPMPTGSTMAAPDAPAPAAPVPIALSHAEIAARLDLPASVAGAETHLLLTDPRWQASHAVIARSEAGGLMLDVETRDGDDSDGQREALRARLEARGHRVEEIRFSGG